MDGVKFIGGESAFLINPENYHAGKFKINDADHQTGALNSANIFGKRQKHIFEGKKNQQHS